MITVRVAYAVLKGSSVVWAKVRHPHGPYTVESWYTLTPDGAAPTWWTRYHLLVPGRD